MAYLLCRAGDWQRLFDLDLVEGPVPAAPAELADHARTLWEAGETLDSAWLTTDTGEPTRLRVEYAPGPNGAELVSFSSLNGVPVLTVEFRLPDGR